MIQSYRALCADSQLYGTLPVEMKEQADEVSSMSVFLIFQWLKFCYEHLETPAMVLTWLQSGTLTREQVPILVDFCILLDL